MLAIEKSRINSMGLHEHKKHNNYIKAIISIFAVAVLLSTMGVPIYNGIYAMENNALPYDMGIVATSSNSATASGHAGNLILFELYNWGEIPTAADVGNMIVGALINLGLTYLLPASEITTISQTIVIMMGEDGTTTIVVETAIDSTALVTPGVAEALAMAIIAA